MMAECPVPVVQNSERRLYGLPGSEYLVFDPSEVVEQWLCDAEDDEPRVFVIEEFSVHPTRYHLPDADRLLEWINEWTCENGEVGEDMELDCGDEVTAAVEALLDLIAAKVTWCMADKKLRELHVTPSDDPDNPLIDGQPAWVSAEHSGVQS